MTMKPITDEILIAEGIEPMVAAVYGMVDRIFPPDGNAKTRRAALELFISSAFERMPHAQRLELIGALSSRWKKGSN